MFFSPAKKSDFHSHRDISVFIEKGKPNPAGGASETD